LTVIIPIWVPGDNPDGSTETVMVPEFVPDVGEQLSQDALSDIDQFKVPLPLLLIRKFCDPVDQLLTAAPKANCVLFKDIEAWVIENASLSP
jgi:hypothetical protein